MKPYRPSLNQIKSYRFAVFALRLVKSRKPSFIDQTVWRQFIRAASAVGANIEEAQAAESPKDYLHKFSLAAKELRESLYWIRLIRDSEIATPEETNEVYLLGQELLKMLTKSIKTLRLKLEK